MNNDFLSHLLKYQAIYALIVSFIVSWTLLGSRLDIVEKTIAEQAIAIKVIEGKNQEVLIKLGRLETSVGNIEKGVDFLMNKR